MLVSGSVSLFSPDSAHVINVHLPVFDAMSLSWTFSGFHCQVWMHLSCNLFEWLKTMLWRWGFPRVFSPPQKRGGFKTHGISTPWPSTDFRAQQADFGRWTIWNVTWRWPVVPRGPGLAEFRGRRNGGVSLLYGGGGSMTFFSGSFRIDGYEFTSNFCDMTDMTLKFLFSPL